MILEYPCAMQRRNIHRRRERNVFKYAIAIAIVFHIYTQVLHAAPTSYDSLLPQSSDMSEYFSDISGCYYNFQRYEEGDRIVTNEPCLNCTCHNRMLMCYLRVCLFTKAIGQDCTIEKKPDQCCPIITCPEVPVKLLTSSTTSSPTPTMQTTEIGFHDNYGCSIHDSFYVDGAQVPADPKKPCELCYCIRNQTACVMQECTLQVEGCQPVYQEGVCCPVRYDCDYEREITSTVRLQTSGGFIKSTTYASVIDCQYGNQTYSDGELITTEKPCEHCYCMRGDIVCAVQECGEPLQGKDCIPTIPPPERCCPSSYECPTDTLPTESIIKGTEFSNTKPPNQVSISEKLTTFEASTIKYDRPSTILSQEEIYNRLGESTSRIPSLAISTQQAEDSHSTSSSTPLSNHQPINIYHDDNLVDKDEHQTIISNEPQKGDSFSSSEGTTQEIPTFSFVNTVKPVPFTDNQITLRPHTTDDLNQNDKNQANKIANQNVSNLSGQNTYQLDESLTSLQTDSSVVAEINTKSSQTTKTDIEEIVEKVTDSPHRNPTTLIDVTEPITAVFETITKLSSKPTDDIKDQSPEVVLNDQTQENQKETSQYLSTTMDYTKDKISTTIQEESLTSKVSIADTTQNISEPEDEQTTESLNTVSNRNTESVPQDNSQSNSKAPESVTQLPKINTEVISSQSSKIKPQYSIDTTSGTLEGEKETTTATAGIPGEGSCLVDGITYQNSSIIESSNPCHSKCVCLSSIPTCTLIKCDPPPTDPKCMPIQIKPESCCPAYVCGGNEPSSPIQPIPSDNHIASSHQPNKFTIEDIISTTVVPLRSSTLISTANNNIIDQNLANTIDAQEKQTIAPSDEIISSKFSTLQPLTSNVEPFLNHVSPSNNGLLSDEIPNNGLSNEEQETKLPEQDVKPLEQEIKPLEHEHSQVTIKELPSSSTPISQEYQTTVDEDVPVDVTPHYLEQPLPPLIGNDETTVTPQENDIVASNSVIPEEHDQALSTVLPSDIPLVTFNNISDKVPEITTLGNIIPESNDIKENEPGDATTITSSIPSSTIKHIATDSSINNIQSSTTIVDSNIAFDNSENESTAGTTLLPVSNSNKENEDNLIVLHHSSVTAGIFETTEGAVQTTQNIDEATTSLLHESNSINTKSSSSPLSTVIYQNQLETSTAFISTVKINDDNKITGTTLTEPSSDNIDETTLSVEQIHTTIPPSNDPLQKFSSFLPTIVTPDSVKLTTDRTTSLQTEIFESTVASSEQPLYEMTQAVENSSSVIEEDGKPEDGLTTNIIQDVISSSPISIFSNDITTYLNKITNKFGNVPTEYLSPETSSVAVDNLYEGETTTEKQSVSAIEKDDKTTEPQFTTSSLMLPQSPHFTYNTNSPIAGNETDMGIDSLPTTISHQEELVQQHDIYKSSTAADQQQSISIVTGSSTPKLELSTITTDIKSSFSTKHQASAVTDSLPVTSKTSSASSFEPIQHSTWTRKPTEETSTSTSEANYYPQPSMYPPGIDHSNEGGEVGTAMEEYDEDNGAFGPGTCRYAGKVYVSAQQIPRDDPCDFCFCFRSDIICLQQSCPPPIHGCRQEPIQGFCCPRYECPVASYANQNTTITTTTTTISPLAPSRPRRFPAEPNHSSVKKTGCVIGGYSYKVGDDIGIASGPCLTCICGQDGRMQCHPINCSPERYVRQIMAESAYRKR